MVCSVKNPEFAKIDHFINFNMVGEKGHHIYECIFGGKLTTDVLTRERFKPLNADVLIAEEFEFRQQLAAHISVFNQMFLRMLFSPLPIKSIRGENRK